MAFNDHGKAPLGALAWFQTSGLASHDRQAMAVRLEASALGGFLPRARSTQDAMRLAVKATEQECSCLPLDEPGLSGQLVMANIPCPEKDLIVWDAHLRVRDPEAKEVGYRRIAQIRHNGSATVNIFDHSDPVLAAILESIPGRAHEFQGKLDSCQLRTMANSFIDSMRGLRVRTGVAFITATNIAQLQKCAKVMEDLDQGTVQCSIYRVEDTPENRKTVAADVRAGLDDALGAVTQEVEDIKTGKAKYPKAALATAAKNLATLQEQIQEMEAALDMRLSNMSAIEALKKALEVK